MFTWASGGPGELYCGDASGCTLLSELRQHPSNLRGFAAAPAAQPHPGDRGRVCGWL